MSASPSQQGPDLGHPKAMPAGLPRPSPSWLWWLPALLGGLYAITVLVHMRAVLGSVWLSSDSDIDGVLAHLDIHAPAGALMTTGDYPHYETLAFALLTRSLPLYRTIWVVAPVLFAVVGLGAVVASTWRSFGRWPASVVAAALVCFGGGATVLHRVGGLATILAMDAHANTVISAAVVGAALVWIVPRTSELGAPQLMAGAAVVGLVGGLAAAGDDLYLAWGLAPLVVVTGLAAWRGPQRGVGRVLAFGLGAAAATVMSDVAFAAIMRGQGVRGFSPSYHTFLTFASPAGIVTNLETLLRAFPSLTAGSFYGRGLDASSEFALVSAVLLFAGLVAGVWSVRRRVANSLPRAAGGGEVVGPRFVHTTFWLTVLVAGLFVFMIGTPNRFTTDGRYLLGPYVAVAALLPLMLERGLGWKLITTAAVSVFAFSALFQSGAGIRLMSKGYQTAATARALAAFARREHIAVGYGNYWNSIDLMWESDFRVRVYPVQRCSTDHQRLCTFKEIAISTWDQSLGNVRSMLVVNPGAGQAPPASRQFGRTVASTRIGGLDVYVYPYDIATRLGYEAGLTL